MTSTRHYGSRQQQRGAILFISLIMLLMLTIIGVTSMSSVTMEERMAGNLRDGDLSFQAAEAALRTGENWVLGLVKPPAYCTSTNTLCATAFDTNVLPNLGSQGTTFWNANAQTFNMDGGISGDPDQVYADPQFVIELQSFVRDTSSLGHTNDVLGSHFFKISAHGTGGSTAAETVLQSIVAKRLDP